MLKRVEAIRKTNNLQQKIKMFKFKHLTIIKETIMETILLRLMKLMRLVVLQILKVSLILSVLLLRNKYKRKDQARWL